MLEKMWGGVLVSMAASWSSSFFNTLVYFVNAEVGPRMVVFVLTSSSPWYG